MTRLLVLVEGDSEELFVKNILSPHLEHFGVYARATGVISKRLASGEKFTGSNLWPNVQRSLRPLLADSDAWVTTLLDLYGLPNNFPGVSGTSANHGVAKVNVQTVELAIAETMGNPQHFIPFLALHEFETWYFSKPSKVACFFGKPDVEMAMECACQEVGGPENINHGKETHPSKRLESYNMGFRKTSAVALLKDIGLDAIRTACPHFDGWLKQLEALGK